MEPTADSRSDVIRSVRTLLISDVHLGCKHSRPKEFLAFLRSFRPEKLYIVGDFIDGWKINAGWHWPDECDQIVEHLVQLAGTGTEIFYTPGNHDSFLRTPAFATMLPSGFPAIEVADEFVLETKRGWRFLVTHGDLFDFFETKMQWISKGSSFFYDTCLSLNRLGHRFFSRKKGNPYGVCARLKDRVKRGVRFISRFESRLMRHASEQNCEGVICGHIHTPAIVQSKDFLYCNTGDWVENCTGLVETLEGKIELISRYGEQQSLNLPVLQERVSMPEEPTADETPAETDDSFNSPVLPQVAVAHSSSAPARITA